MTKPHLRMRELAYCALFSALIAAGAFLKVPVPALPFTLQFLFTNLAGILLGAKLGALSVLVYLLLALVGLPIFANGGGFGYVLMPSFGYLIGFLFGTWVAGRIVTRAKTHVFRTCLLYTSL